MEKENKPLISIQSNDSFQIALSFMVSFASKFGIK